MLRQLQALPLRMLSQWQSHIHIFAHVTPAKVAMGAAQALVSTAALIPISTVIGIMEPRTIVTPTPATWRPDRRQEPENKPTR